MSWGEDRGGGLCPGGRIGGEGEERGVGKGGRLRQSSEEERERCGSGGCVEAMDQDSADM